MSHSDPEDEIGPSVLLIWQKAPSEHDLPWFLEQGLSRFALDAASVPRGLDLPVLVDLDARPLPYWSDFFESVSPTLSPLSMKSYAYDARRLADFLLSRGSSIVAATQEDLVAYRIRRTSRDGEGVSRSTWQRERTLISLVYKFLVLKKVMSRPPWITIGRRTPIDYPGVPSPMAIRFLSQEQWMYFRNVGLGGQRPDGSIDESCRVAWPLRGIAGATLALTTGMRLREFSSVFDFEIPLDGGTGASFEIEATAKFSRRRTVHVPAETVRLINLYRRSERQHALNQTVTARALRVRDLAIVEHIDHQQGRIHVIYGGTQLRWDVSRLPSELRRICVQETDNGFEPLSLFVGSNGFSPQQRTWSATFDAAADRIDSFRPSSAAATMPKKVTAHDLRHTFAVVMLRYLMVRASEREFDRRSGEIGQGTMSDHLVHSPILTVQRLLGHASPLSTMTYLRYVEDTELIVRRALDTWSDTELTYADYISELFTRELKP